MLLRRRTLLTATAIIVSGRPALALSRKQQRLLSGAHITVSRGLLGYWPFNGNGNDISGNGNNLTLNNGPSFVAGIGGQAISFDGATQTATSLIAANVSTFSWSCVIKGNATPGSAKISVPFVWGATGSPTNHNAAGIQWDHTATADEHAVFVQAPAGTFRQAQLSVLTGGTTYAIGSTWDGATLIGYVNGTANVSVPATGTMQTPQGGVAFGSGGSTGFWPGTLQFCWMANVAYLASEMKAAQTANLAGRL